MWYFEIEIIVNLLESILHNILIRKLISGQEPHGLSLGNTKNVNTVINNGKVVIVCCQNSIVCSCGFNWNEDFIIEKKSLTIWITWHSIKVDHQLSIFRIHNPGIAIDKYVPASSEIGSVIVNTIRRIIVCPLSYSEFICSLRTLTLPSWLSVYVALTHFPAIEQINTNI